MTDLRDHDADPTDHVRPIPVFTFGRSRCSRWSETRNVVACGFATVTIHLMLQHGNIAYRAGNLRRVFSVAELHRWHHQRLYADVQGNYGALLSVWDALFGSALHKRGDAPPDVGMDDEPDLPLDWLGQHLWPFRRSAPTQE